MKTQMIATLFAFLSLFNCSLMDKLGLTEEEVLQLLPFPVDYFYPVDPGTMYPNSGLHIYIGQTEVGQPYYLKLANLDTGKKRVLPFPPNTHYVYSAAFNSDCSSVYFGAAHTTQTQFSIFRMDLLSGETYQVVPWKSISPVRFYQSPSRRYLAYMDQNYKLYVFDTRTDSETLVHTFTSSYNFTSLAWVDDTTVAVAAENLGPYKLYRFNIQTKTLGSRITQSDMFYRELNFIRSGEWYYFLAAGDGYSVQGIHRTKDLISSETIYQHGSTIAFSVMNDSKGNTYMVLPSPTTIRTSPFLIKEDGTYERLTLEPESDWIYEVLSFCKAYPQVL